MKYYNAFTKIKNDEAKLYQEILDKDAEYFDEGDFPEDATLFSVEGEFEQNLLRNPLPICRRQFGVVVA